MVRDETNLIFAESKRSYFRRPVSRVFAVEGPLYRAIRVSKRAWEPGGFAAEKALAASRGG
jgi:hypothetical protein